MIGINNTEDIILCFITKVNSSKDRLRCYKDNNIKKINIKSNKVKNNIFNAKKLI